MDNFVHNWTLNPLTKTVVYNGLLTILLLENTPLYTQLGPFILELNCEWAATNLSVCLETHLFDDYGDTKFL